MKKPKPKYKTGDICFLVVAGFEDDPEEWQETMVIDGKPTWNSYKQKRQSKRMSRKTFKIKKNPNQKTMILKKITIYGLAFLAWASYYEFSIHYPAEAKILSAAILAACIFYSLKILIPELFFHFFLKAFHKQMREYKPGKFGVFVFTKIYVPLMRKRVESVASPLLVYPMLIFMNFELKSIFLEKGLFVAHKAMLDKPDEISKKFKDALTEACNEKTVSMDSFI